MGKELVTIPLNQLKHSAFNVRKTERLKDIEQMASSIKSKGLLENLIVRQASGKGTTRVYEVIAGGRRLAALKLLAKRKKIGKHHAIPCRIVDGLQDADLIEVSLAENIVRAPMHPADQFDAFAKLQEEGLSAEDIAARFGLPVTVILQRLKLSAVSPRLIAEYRAGEMTLEQLIAFTICDDRGAQEQFWFESSFLDRSPQAIRRFLTRSHVEGADRRARFVGAKAFEEAGGIIIRGLFQSETNGFFTDSQLLARLVADKLRKTAEAVRAEGWGWVEIQEMPDYAYLAQFGRIRPTDVKLSKREERRVTTLCERYDELVTKMEEDVGEGMSAELNRVSAELDAFRSKKETWPNEEKGQAGAVVSLEHDGTLRVDRGLVKQAEVETNNLTKTRERKGSNDGHPGSLLVELSAQRTAALREGLASRAQDALTALLYTLASDVFFGGSNSCLEISETITDLSRFSEEVGQGKASSALLARHARWQELLPAHDDLWRWLEATNLETRLDLLAYCVGMGVDAVYRSGDNGRVMNTNGLAQTIGLDMSEWWRPTSAGYFDHLTKEQIVSVVAEGCSSEAARRLSGLKKGEMSEVAERLMLETRWVPSPLRTPPSEIANVDNTAVTPE